MRSARRFLRLRDLRSPASRKPFRVRSADTPSDAASRASETFRLCIDDCFCHGARVHYALLKMDVFAFFLCFLRAFKKMYLFAKYARLVCRRIFRCSLLNFIRNSD